MGKTGKTLQKKDYSISCVRFIAMCFIVICHMMQRDAFSTEIYGAHIEWAFWFNIGVQMFLFLSGYLYGQKGKIDVIEFYGKAIPKILVDYYVFIVVMIIVIRISPLLDVGADGILGLLTFSRTVPGLGHLWFIPTILFCYLFVPILAEIVNAIDIKEGFRFWIEVFLSLLIIQATIMAIFRSFNAAWINCFVIGMIYSKIERKGDKDRKTFIQIVIVLCLVIIPIKFAIGYGFHVDLPLLLRILYWQFSSYGHVVLGVAAVISIRFIYRQCEIKCVEHPFFDWSDKYSYDVYLVHHVFVQSAWGCVEYISNRWLALPLAVFLTLIFSIVLNHFSCYVKSKLIVIFRKLLDC